MAEKSWFFNSAPGDPRVYQASDFAQYFGKVLSTGLLHIDNVPGLQVKAGGTDLRTYVEPGGAIMEGYAYENTDNVYLTHSLPEVSLDRIDRVVLRLDKKNANRYIKVFIREGVPATVPVPPTLQRDNLVWELSLAQVRLRANTSAISPADVFDERLDRTVAGLVYSLISKPSLADIQTGGYSATATTEGQTDFEIPLVSFDKVGDGLTVYVNGEKAPYNSYEVIYPRTVRFNVGKPLGTLVEFGIIRGVLKLDDSYVVNAGEVGIIDAGNYYESENVEGALQKIGLTLYGPKPKVYGVRIDLENPHPTDSVTYIDDASGFTGPADFANVYPFNQIKPCVLRKGAVAYYLNPNDFTKKADGTPSDITSWLVGDVMIEFPKLYWSVKKEGKSVFIRFTEAKIDGSFDALAHEKNKVIKDKIYISAYPVSLDPDGNYRSVSGKTAATNTVVSTYQSKIITNGSGYQAFGWFQLQMLLLLFVVRYKTLNSDQYFGHMNTFTNVTGSLDKVGMNRDGAGVGANKFMGLEQFVSSYAQKVAGIYLRTGRIVVTNDGSLYANPTGVESSGYAFEYSQLGPGFVSDILGTQKGIFLPTAVAGSVSTFFTDYAHSTNTGALNNIVYHGAARAEMNYNGFFSIGLANDSTTINSFIRMVYV